MPFTVTVLGTCSAIPAHDRHPSAQVVTHNSKMFLFDCGEGTQMQMLKYKVKASRINHIFISHLHGDHYLGLMGLISSYHLLGRTNDLHIYAPEELQEIINLHTLSAGTIFRYKILFHDLEETPTKPIFDDNDIYIESVTLKHRIPTFGFIVREKSKQVRILKDAVIKFDLLVEEMQQLKEGLSEITRNGNPIPAGQITEQPTAPLSFAYISDTIFDESLIEILKGVSLLYHEATFGNDMADIATEKFHTTAAQAAIIAAKAGVGRLLIGHFSARYKTHINLLKEAQSVFKATEAAEEGKIYII